ncbi:MAG: T9SS type A sorting domain-containing protein [Bacteroidales bacterium]|nr:T9SS type A sorting domain-containing protein [Bacteroidales bacterium]
MQAVEVFGITEIDLGADTVVRALEYTIDPGAGYDSYLWQDGTMNQTLVIDTTGWYRVTVTEGTKCENSDSVHVTLIIPDIGINRITNPANACELSSTENLDLYVHNAGSDTLTTNDTILVTYKVNSGTVVNDTLFVDRTVVPGDSVLYSSTQKVDLSIPDIYNFTITVDYSKDLISSNDNVNQNIEVYGDPAVSLGDDQVVNLKTYLLDAGSGFTSYAWQDGSADQYFTVLYEDQEPDQTYTVTVTDDKGCQDSDDIVVSFGLTDIGIEALMNPLSGCDLTDQERLVVRIRNYGTTAIFNERIDLTARVNNGTTVNGRKTVSTIFNPGDSLDFTFGSNFDFSNDGDHTVHIDVTLSTDPFSSNDSVDLVIINYDNPDINLGGINDTISRNLPYTFDAGADYEAYVWNGVEGERTYEADAYGWYKLEVTDVSGCYGSDLVYLDVFTFLPEILTFEELKIYPNPSDNILFIELKTSEYRDIYIEMFDGMGRKVMIREFKQVYLINEPMDVSDISKGVYYIRIRSGNKQMISKVIIL